MGDIVAADVSRGYIRYFYVHMVLEIQKGRLASWESKEDVMMYVIGNIKGRVNGSASRAYVYGKVTSVQEVLGGDTDHPVYQERTGSLSPQTLQDAAANANLHRRWEGWQRTWAGEC